MTDAGLIISWEDRYRGAVDEADTGNTGVIGVMKMNPGNYVMYTGQNEGTWIKNYMYQWNGSGWNELAWPTAANRQNAEKYWEGMGYLDSGGPVEVFSKAQIGSLIALEAFIKNLFSNIHVISGYLQSEAVNAQGEPLVLINMQTGKLKAIDAVIKGKIEATSGSFTGRIEANEGYFIGDLEAGSFRADNIDIKSQLVAGTLYIVRSNDAPVTRPSGTYNTYGTAKRITTPAKGIVTVRISVYVPPGGRYTVIIQVNGSEAAQFNQGTGYSNYTHEANITLTQNDNTISLCYRDTTEGVTFNTFWIMSGNNPRFLRYLG